MIKDIVRSDGTVPLRIDVNDTTVFDDTDKNSE
ncbi:hypothetical protein SAMN05421507_115129 [Lentzea jiangxiensis]|uniref:Uncharacterized protein n=1 Tax=Lentzea jiangxiensis TaxID=641025 RepID=A0A1H0VTE7_9PSEU|nr:hypothetical protein SAMN05421507_115129 [Lentzea jiangxiensis]